MDWPQVRIGAKTEFRTRPREGSRLLTCATPTPVVAYRPPTNPFGRWVTKLMVLLERRYEPVFAIAEDPAAIAREGFETYDQFRRYWRGRSGGKYAPLQRVWVWRVRLWTPGDHHEMGLRLLTELYGEHLP